MSPLEKLKPRIKKPATLALVLLLVVGGIGAIELGIVGGNDRDTVDSTDSSNVDPKITSSSDALPESQRIEKKKKEFDRAKKLVNPSGYVNAENVNITDYIGEKVILLEFWTYTCHNCQATHPYVKDWYKKYEDDGLVVIGVHTPEFDFEKKKKNVQEAVKKAGIKYPVVLDNSYSTWNAYDQRYWPTRYLIGIDGYIRYKHIGEGAYDETEKKIRELLAERDRVLNSTADISKP